MGLLIPGQWSLEAGLRPPFPVTSDRTVFPSIPQFLAARSSPKKAPRGHLLRLDFHAEFK
ncbi:unnamed protein product, partial [Gulo gulo]